MFKVPTPSGRPPLGPAPAAPANFSWGDVVSRPIKQPAQLPPMDQNLAQNVATSKPSSASNSRAHYPPPPAPSMNHPNRPGSGNGFAGTFPQPTPPASRPPQMEMYDEPPPSRRFELHVNNTREQQREQLREQQLRDQRENDRMQLSYGGYNPPPPQSSKSLTEIPAYRSSPSASAQQHSSNRYSLHNSTPGQSSAPLSYAPPPRILKIDTDLIEIHTNTAVKINKFDATDVKTDTSKAKAMVARDTIDMPRSASASTVEPASSEISASASDTSEIAESKTELFSDASESDHSDSPKSSPTSLSTSQTRCPSCVSSPACTPTSMRSSSARSSVETATSAPADKLILLKARISNLRRAFLYAHFVLLS